ALQNYYLRLNKNIITVFCSGIEISDYENLISDRRALNLPDNKILIGYAGNMIKTNLGDSYGLEEIVRSLKFLPEEFYFVGVGDKNNETAFLKAIAKKEGINESRVILLPWQARQYIPAFLNSFDILVVPCAGGRPGNSPTKMIEYLAAGRPIVACRAQAIMEILRDRENCLLAQNESGDWAQKTAQIYQDKELSKKIVSQALREAGQYTWEKRAQKIADFIKKIYEKNY
ncbi:glycosyltransferase, partial [Patescibacteria group bacterium]|nr:glycosyltransferase [Patescibacteria group bacterium]